MDHCHHVVRYLDHLADRLEAFGFVDIVSEFRTQASAYADAAEPANPPQVLSIGNQPNRRFSFA